MRHRRLQSLTFLLALLLAASSWLPTSGRAEAQMRCTGASPQSAPCARAELPAAGLTDSQVYGVLASCCHATCGGCASMRLCPMRQQSRSGMGTRHATLAARRCIATVRVAIAPTTPAVRRTRQFLTTPALAPLMTTPAAVRPAGTIPTPLWTYSPALSPHASPRLHGLRAPPTA